jgi:AraC-like DNA-binding protein
LESASREATSRALPATINVMMAQRKIAVVQRPAAARKPPVDPPYTAAVISTCVLAVLAELADLEHVPVGPWLTGHGISRAQIDDASVRISYRQASLILKRALKSIPHGDIGLRVGTHQSIGSFGIVGLAMMTARTFGEAIAIGVENALVSHALMDLELETAANGNVAVVARPRFADPEILAFLCEELFASTLILARTLAGASFTPVLLELTYPAPKYAAKYRSLFGCEVRFGGSRNRVVVEPRWLDLKLPTHHPISAQQALAICRDQAAQVQRQSEIVASVERILRLRLTEHPTLAGIAQSLNLTERTLRRRLAASGRVFREIHNQLRTERALELLSAGALSVAEIGGEVGFSDAREFRRAFKRWTGAPPAAMRHAHT